MSPAVQSAPKKRPAKTQAGPSTKKPHLEKAVDTKAKKRSRPITSSLPDDSADTSDEDGSAEELSEQEVKDDDADMGVEERIKDPNGQ